LSAETDTNVPRGMVVPFENVKSFIATRDNVTKKRKNIVVRSEKERGKASLTIPKISQSLRLFDETIEFMHLVKAGFGPTFRFDYFLHLLPKRLHVLWEGS
jgi:hypothetical protein